MKTTHVIVGLGAIGAFWVFRRQLGSLLGDGLASAAASLAEGADAASTAIVDHITPTMVDNSTQSASAYQREFGDWVRRVKAGDDAGPPPSIDDGLPWWQRVLLM